MSRSWQSLGGVEAQLETGTSNGPFEQLQRAAELVARRKQREELTLCERLNLVGALLSSLGDKEGARAQYERVLRIEEWGIGESERAGDQHDNAEETLRHWWCERSHALFRLLCLHHDAGRADEAAEVSAALEETEATYTEDAKALVATRAGQLEQAERHLQHVAAQLCGIEPPPIHAPPIEIDMPAATPAEVAILAAPGPSSEAPAATSVRAASTPLEEDAAVAEWCRAVGLDATDAWLERVQARLERAAAEATAELQREEEEAPLQESTQLDTEEAGIESGEPPGAAATSAAETPSSTGGAAAAAGRRKSGQGVLPFWDVSNDEAKMAKREMAARRSAYAALGGGDGVSMLEQIKMELSVQEQAELQEAHKEFAALRAIERQLSKQMQPTTDRLQAAAHAPGGGGHSRMQPLPPGAPSLVQEELALRLRALRILFEWVRRRYALEGARLSEQSATEEIELYKCPRRLPDGDPAAALGELRAACARLSAGCHALERELSDLRGQRIDELSRDRSAMRPPRLGSHDALAQLAITSSGGAVGAYERDPLNRRQHDLAWIGAAHAASHCCAVHLSLRLALLEWIAEHADAADSNWLKRSLYGTRADQLSRKMRLLEHCLGRAELHASDKAREQVANWLLRELPGLVAVPCRRIASAEESRFRLENGNGVELVTSVVDEKELVWDGSAYVAGKNDGEASGASFEPGPWRWEEVGGHWRRDRHPHEILVVAGCGHNYSEVFWSLKLSTVIDYERGVLKARKARCCAPLANGTICGKPLVLTKGLRVTHCNPARAPPLPTVDTPSRREPPLTVDLTLDEPEDGVSFLEEDGGGVSSVNGGHLSRCQPLSAPSSYSRDAMSTHCMHGYWGTRVEMAVRLLLEIRRRADVAGDRASAKAVVFSRFEQTLALLARACAMNGVSATVPKGGLSPQQEVAAFCAEGSPTQALLLAAHRNAAGLTLTAASHVLILEPQPELATELQMIGRVHRIGQVLHSNTPP
mgnify:CR=1 FL=1